MSKIMWYRLITSRRSKGVPERCPFMTNLKLEHHLPDPGQSRFPDSSLLDEAGPDVLAFSSFPLAHWTLVQQPTGASQPGDARCGGHLP